MSDHRITVVRGSSVGSWVTVGIAVVGAVLWARHQAVQVERLQAAAGLPHQSFVAGLRERTAELSRDLTRRFSTRKGA